MQRIGGVLLATVLFLAARSSGTSVFQLEVGDCFDTPSSTEDISSVERIDCTQPHDNEVFADLTMPDGEWPGDDAVAAWADQACLDEFAGYVGVGFDESSLSYGWLVPTEDSWTQGGDRSVSCALFDAAGGKLTGSMKGTGT